MLCVHLNEQASHLRRCQTVHPGRKRSWIEKINYTSFRYQLFRSSHICYQLFCDSHIRDQLFCNSHICFYYSFLVASDTEQNGCFCSFAFEQHWLRSCKDRGFHWGIYWHKTKAWLFFFYFFISYSSTTSCLLRSFQNCCRTSAQQMQTCPGINQRTVSPTSSRVSPQTGD